MYLHEKIDKNKINCIFVEKSCNFVACFEILHYLCSLKAYFVAYRERKEQLIYYIGIMKRKSVILALAFVALLLSSCQEKIQTTTVKVKKTTDTTMVATIDKYDITFDVKQARCDNGAIMAGDSVVVHYIGDLRDKQAKALLLRLIPKKGTVVEAVYDPSKELKTKPMTPEEQKQFEEGIEFAKKHGH